MRDVCTRQPWGLKRLLGRHGGGAGIVVYGWFSRLHGWTPRGSWEAVAVVVDGQQRVVVDQFKRGPVWIELDPGGHLVEFLTSGRVLHSERIYLSAEQAVLAAFRPPNNRPIARLRVERWCVRQL